MTDPTLNVEARMTSDERIKFLDRMVGLNPHMRGAKPADLLGILVDSDAYLGASEILWDALPDAPERAAAIVAAVVLTDNERPASDPDTDWPKGELERVRARAQRLMGASA